MRRLFARRVKITSDLLPGQYVQTIYEILCSSAMQQFWGTKFYLQSGYGLN